ELRASRLEKADHVLAVTQIDQHGTENVGARPLSRRYGIDDLDVRFALADRIAFRQLIEHPITALGDRGPGFVELALVQRPVGLQLRPQLPVEYLNAAIAVC